MNSRKTEQEINFSFDPANPDYVEFGSLIQLFTYNGVPWFKGVYSRCKGEPDGQVTTLYFLTEDGEVSVDPKDVTDYEVLFRG